MNNQDSGNVHLDLFFVNWQASNYVLFQQVKSGMVHPYCAMLLHKIFIII